MIVEWTELDHKTGIPMQATHACTMIEVHLDIGHSTPSPLPAKYTFLEIETRVAQAEFFPASIMGDAAPLTAATTTELDHLPRTFR
jgi:hypothetical protein